MRIIEPSHRNGVKTEKERKLKGVNWQVTLQYRRVQEAGVKQGIDIFVIGSSGRASSRERCVILVAQSKS